MRDMKVIGLVVLLLIVAQLALGCSHATYKERYNRTPALRKQEAKPVRVTFPNGDQFDVYPVQREGE